MAAGTVSKPYTVIGNMIYAYLTYKQYDGCIYLRMKISHTYIKIVSLGIYNERVIYYS